MTRILPRAAFLGLTFLWTATTPTQVAGQEPRQPAPTQIAEGVYLLHGLGCNVTTVDGPDGVLIIDTGYKRDIERLRQAAASVDPAGIRKAIFTHIHWDHLGASEALGLDGVELIAHVNTRRRMTEEWRAPENPVARTPVIPPYPEVALPSVTFEDSMELEFGGQEIRVVHFPGGHSDTDAVVFLRDRNVVHTGDLYMSNGFPYIDVTHGGSLDRYIQNVQALIQRIDESTVVVPGHGPLSDREGLRRYREMLIAARDRIAALVQRGLTVEEVLASDPTAGLYEGGDSYLNPQLLVWAVYFEMTGQGS
jgi:glyoxylase-like metal-dependent hydrolase (beta-lactamase superfamily II)